MTPLNRATCAAIAPYAVWMGLLFTLPATALGYAVRTAATLAVLVWCGRTQFGPLHARPRHTFCKPVVSGVLAGLAVCALWIFPEQFAWYRETSLMKLVGLAPMAATETASPYDPATCGWPLTLVRLAGSAFVIAPVEEIFFRSFLYRRLQNRDWTNVPLNRFDLSAFLWMVGLFALEHDTRLMAGAMAGAVYGALAIRRGLGAAIVAHVTTNLALGLFVIATRQWGFW